MSNARTETVPGDHEEDSATTEPRIRLRAGDIYILQRREGRTRFSPVARGQTPRFRPRLIALMPKGLEEAVYPPLRCLLKKNNQNRGQKIRLGDP